MKYKFSIPIAISLSILVLAAGISVKPLSVSAGTPSGCGLVSATSIGGLTVDLRAFIAGEGFQTESPIVAYWGQSGDWDNLTFSPPNPSGRIYADFFHTYSTGGTFTITGTDNMDNNCGSVTASVSCLGIIGVSVTHSPAGPVNTGVPVTWTANVTGGGGCSGSGVTYSWSGDEGVSGSTQTANKSYSTVGTKNATVTVTKGGGSASANDSINVSGTGFQNPTGFLSSPSCPISDGQSTCTASISGSISNPSGPSFAISADFGPWPSGPTGSVTGSVTIPHGSNSNHFYLYSGWGSPGCTNPITSEPCQYGPNIASSTGSAECAGGPSHWISGSCQNPVGPPQCAAGHYNCTVGTSSSQVDGASAWTWNCTSGTTISCSEPKPSVINGACASTHYNCSAGTSINNVAGSSSWTWTCQGSGGGSNASCSEAMTPPPPMSASLSASNCQVNPGSSSCSSNISWSATTNPQGTTAVTTPVGVTVATDSGNDGGIATYPISMASPDSGSRTFYLYNNGVFLDSKTPTASCFNSTWNGSICAAAAGPTGTLAVTNCTLPLNIVNPTCNTSVSGSSSNITSGTVNITKDRPAAGTVVAPPPTITPNTTFSSISSAISYGTTTFHLNNNGVDIAAQAQATATCGAGTWDGVNKCITSSNPSGTLTASGCSIPNGSSTCPVTVSWNTFSNLSIGAATNVTRNNPAGTVVWQDASYVQGENLNGTNTTNLRGTFTFYLNHNSSEIHTPVTVVADCSPGIWYPALNQCGAPPQGTYTLSVSGAGSGCGTITGDITCAAGQTCSGNFASGQGITLNANPGPTSNFDHWSATPNVCSGTVASCSFNMPANNTAVTANFGGMCSLPVIGQCATPPNHLGTLCTAGTATSVTSNISTWTWKCNGSDPAVITDDAPCSQNKPKPGIIEN